MPWKFFRHAFRSTLAALVGLILAIAVLSEAPQSMARAETLGAVPAPLIDAPKIAGAPQTAVLAGGCFWGVQGVFEHLKGVRQVVAGYSGGTRTTAHYELVGTGGTGHAESVEITYDPQLVSYGEILQVFFSVAHDPTQLNRQGPDSGSQYRSVIFYADATQQSIATQYIAQLNRAGVYRSPIRTRVDPFQGFFAAEDYHQDFLLHHPGNPYIVFNDLPKIQNFQKLLPALYNGKPATLAAR